MSILYVDLLCGPSLWALYMDPKWNGGSAAALGGLQDAAAADGAALGMVFILPTSSRARLVGTAC